jgi:NTE family protein
METDFSNSSSDSIVELGFAFTQHDVGPYRGEWINELMLGWERMLASEFYQPLEESQHYFARTRIQFALDKWEETKERSELTKKYFQANASVGYNYVNNGAIELGFIGEKGELAFKSENKFLDYDSVGGYFSFNYDNLNSINFPTEGNKFSFDVFVRNDHYQEFKGVEPQDTSVEVRFDWRGAFHISNHAFVGIASFATVSNDTDFSVHVTELGGFLNLSGYQKDALIGPHKAFAAIVYQYNLGNELFGNTSLPLYLGTSIESGNVWQLNETVKIDDIVRSGSLYLGTDTDFGPAVFGVGFASGGENTVFLSLGKSF